METRAADSVTLDCRNPVAEMVAPESGYEVIGDAVAIVTSTTSKAALQTRAAGNSNPPQRLFAKNGLLVRSNTRSEFIVPKAWHKRLSFRWGNAGPQQASEHFVVGPCNGATEWMAFPGGYFVPDTACVQFIVRTSDGEHPVSVGVGAPCAGQVPPAEPTEK